jgi:phosphoglycolate phosphatase-like HAD superfamily hydrolase
MKNITDYDVILWDFDGVIMDSMPIRSKGFEIVLKNFPEEQIEQLMIYHNENGGLSRYVKFRYFFEVIRNEKVTEEQIAILAHRFSEIMLQNLTDNSLLIKDTLNFIIKYYQKISMHVVSGSDGNELKLLCQNLKIDKYFKSIHGSPTPKNVLVSQVLIENNYSINRVALIGDSRNDLEASQINKIDFFGYNNPKLLEKNYITELSVY